MILKNSLKVVLLLLITTVGCFAQSYTPIKKVTLTGTVIDELSGNPLEYATIVLQSVNKPNQVTGGVTDLEGKFELVIDAGLYNFKVEFISFKSYVLNNQNFKEDRDFGKITLSEDVAMLSGVVVRAERTSVEIKLDKKVYNVGQDLMIKGGTVSDVLDNVPSVSVDIEGNVSLRGNENVRILIDGRPSGLAALNIAEALKLIPADAIEKVEVITNPSARYDAEGGGGIINIILKKGENLGFNGVVIASTGIPDNHGLSANLNYKTRKFNIFTTTGYNLRNSPGNVLMDSRFKNADGSTRTFIDERRESERIRKGLSSNAGIELFIDDNTTWTNSVSYSNNIGDNSEDVLFYNYNPDREFLFTRERNYTEDEDQDNLEFASNFLKKFERDGHQFMIDFSHSKNNDNEYGLISDRIIDGTDPTVFESTLDEQQSDRTLLQFDYVLPFAESSQFEFGYRAQYLESLSKYSVVSDDFGDNPNFNNLFQYNEKVNALYSQYGFKSGSFSYLFGLRWEDSNIDVNFLETDEFNKKKYNNFFPSAFVSYEFSESSSMSLSYSRRISRPRGRWLNPFSGITSNINIFQGNPDLDPAMTNAFDIGYLKRWQKLTFNTSMYLNVTNDVFQFVRRESGEFVNDIPVTIVSPINLATEYRFGYEFTLNYSPYRWWKLNGNFNFFRNETQGEFSYIPFNDIEPVVQNFDNIAFSWFARLTSKVTLPGKVDWQMNGTYNAPQTNAQGRSLGVASMNLAFSKDIMKEKATISFNISDVFNSRKRIFETTLPNVDAYSEMQWRVRAFTLSFTYRFNQAKSKDKQRQGGGDDDFMG
uniref:TonB-dependent receptor domain-containing protein n=2 Tax=Flavobacterium sp. TaxID=239 RepID=UPI004049F302